MDPINTSKSAKEIINGMEALSITPGQPMVMRPRSDLDVAAQSGLGIVETPTKHSQSSPLRPSTQTTETTMPGTSSSPAGPRVNTTSFHPSQIQEAKRFRQSRQCPHSFPGHYKTHRHHPISQAARARLSESYPPFSQMRNRHPAVMGTAAMDHPIPKQLRNRMKLEQMREERRVLINRLRAVEARIDAYQRLSADEDDLEHVLAGIRERTGLVREEAVVGGVTEDLDAMVE